MKPYIVNMTKEQAKEAYQGKEFCYILSDAHKVKVKVTDTKVYGGVVLCRVKPVKVLKADKKDKTNYKDMAKDYILAGRLGL